MRLNDLTNVPATINSGVRSAKQQTMLALLGNPRSSYDVDCQPVTKKTNRFGRCWAFQGYRPQTSGR